MPRVFLSPPDVGSLERDYVNAAIDSNWVAPIGPDLDAFEADLAALSGRQYAVGVSTGTAGIHLCLTRNRIPGRRPIGVAQETLNGSVDQTVHENL